MGNYPAEGKKRRRVPGYLIGLLSLMLLIALGIALALNWLYKSLAAFEAGTPLTALNRYFDALRTGNFEAVLPESGFSPSRWAQSEDYIAFLRRKYGEVPAALRYRKTGAGGNGQTYAVYAGDEKLGEVTLYGTGAGTWRVSTPAEYGPVYTVTAPGHAAVLVNGQPLLQNEAVKTETVPLFDALPEGTEKPAVLTWEVGPMLAQPVFSAEGPGGSPCELTVDEAAHSVLAEVPLTEAQTNEYAALMTEAAKAYSNYVSEDVGWAVLEPHLLPGSDLAARVRVMERGWYIDHDSFAFADLVTSGFRSYSETCFSGEIAFTYEVYRGGTLNSYPVHYNMVYTQTPQGWKLFDLNTL